MKALIGATVNQPSQYPHEESPPMCLETVVAQRLERLEGVGRQAP